MLVKIRNKHLLSLNQLLDKAYAIGAVPSEIEVTPTEAYHLLREYNDMHTNSPYKYEDAPVQLSFSQYQSCEFDIKLWIHSKSPMNRKQGERLVRMWSDNQFGIKYRQLRVKVGKVKSKPTITASVTTSVPKNGVVTGNVLQDRKPTLPADPKV